ncbi:Polysaccharide deacetylase [uncultured archaeon]|nr:Polysaccharide deacetylase [uncultured archaeon]
MKTSILISALAVMALMSLNNAYAEDVCQYASEASATSESDASRAIYAIGIPDAPSGGECSNWSGPGYSWAPQNWNIMANLTLRYNTSVNANNITVIGDYDMCTNSMWVANSTTGKKQLVQNSIDNNCTSVRNVNANFPVDTVILQTCGWSWSSTDAVQLCGSIPTGPVCGNGKIEAPEECDLGAQNGQAGSGCSANCKIENISGTGCSYALSAESSSELPGYEAIYATGAPDSDGNCGTAPSPKTAWQKAAWNVPSNITLTFPYTYPANLTIFGDYDLCINRVWFWRNNSWYLAQAGAIDRGLGLNGSSCNIDYNFSDLNFKTNKAMVETCGWSFAAIDAAKLCGTSDTYPKISIASPEQDKLIDDSQNSVRLQISTDIPSTCEFGKDKNFIMGGGTGLSTTDGLTHSYNMTRPANNSAEIYYKCASSSGKVNPYSMEHRFAFGKISSNSIEVCNWQNCSEGAASFSMDDGFQPTLGYVKAVCQDKLDEKGIKGTYFLAYTNTYNQSDWDIWRNAYAKGHEIGGHSVSHACTATPLDKTFLTSDTQENIAEITQNIGMPASKLVTYDWPCGNYFPEYADWLSPYFQFARGYHINQIESKNPEDFWNLKSVNSLNFGDTPPDYFTLADVAENYRDWVNYVYHDYCNNPEIMDYIKTKNIWVDTIGSVAKYIKERQATTVTDIANTSTGIKFNVVNPLNATIFDKGLTLRVHVGSGNVSKVAVNGADTGFTKLIVGNRDYIRFNVPAKNSNTVEISVSGSNNSVNATCGNSIVEAPEECDLGAQNGAANSTCTADCKNITKNATTLKAYVVPYIGDIDGSIDSGWFYFYDQLRKWHQDNNISVTFSFYSKTIKDDAQFNNAVANMYKCPNCELATKSQGTSERDLDNMSYDEVKAIIGSDQDYFKSKMQQILNTSNVSAPRTYNQLYGRFDPTIRSAVHDLGFNIYLEEYITPEHGYTDSLPDFDITQYSVSFTQSGHPGPNEIFKQPNEVIQNLLDFQNDHALYINGTTVIPLMAHQQDFRTNDSSDTLNQTKWDTYTRTLEMLKNDSRFRLIKGQDVYNLRHPTQPTNNTGGNTTGNSTGNTTGNFTGNFTGNNTGNSTGNTTNEDDMSPQVPPSSGGGGWSASVSQKAEEIKDEITDSLGLTKASSRSCSERWICSSWSGCVNGSQTRECADINKCDTKKDRPATSQSCGRQIALNASNQTTLSTSPGTTPESKVTGNLLSADSRGRAGVIGLTVLAVLAALYLAAKKRLLTGLFRKQGTVS